MAGSGVVPITQYYAMNYIFAGGVSAKAFVGSGGVRVDPFNRRREARTARHRTVVSRASATFQLPRENQVTVPIHVLVLEDLEDDATLLAHEQSGIVFQVFQNQDMNRDSHLVLARELESRGSTTNDRPMARCACLSAAVERVNSDASRADKCLSGNSPSENVIHRVILRNRHNSRARHREIL